MLKISKGHHFKVFGNVRFFKMSNFCLEIRFSQAQHAISDFCFFLKTDFFLRDFFQFVFIEAPPQFLLETKGFASIKKCSRVSAVCDLPETIIEKISKNFDLFFLNFLFFERFSVEKDGVFCCFQMGKNGFRDLCVYFGFFWRCNVN